MKLIWGILFLLVPVGSIGLFLYAAYGMPDHGWWLPKDVSTFGAETDFLFFLILWITGIAFVATQAALCWFLFKYGESKEKPLYIHTHHKAEVIWTAIPAAILIFIALYQFDAWKKIKFTSNFPKSDYLVEVLAGQFEWRITYPGADGKIGTRDDITSVNDFHIPVNKPVIVHLKSRDVLHSFFLPNLRLKQDAVPGMTIPLWFQATETGKFDLVCAELCGWGHYKMKGRLTVETEAENASWLKMMKEDQEKSQ